MEQFANHDEEIEWDINSSFPGEWWLAFVCGFLLAVTLWWVSPDTPQPPPITPRVAQSLGWCDAAKGK